MSAVEFKDLGLNPDILKAVTEAGYTHPTPIQEQAIPEVLKGRDLFGCAQTGTGKTASFILPMQHILGNGRAKARMPRSLVLEPTRELAAQVAENFEVYGKYNKLNLALLIGGESFADQQKILGRGVDVLIATPGRLLDLLERGKILLADLKMLVIDEADRMLDMGFIPDVEKIVSLLPKNHQTLMFSATMPPVIKKLAGAFLNNPLEVIVAPQSSTAATIEQFKIDCGDLKKRDVLRHLIALELPNIQSAIIFCNRKRDVDIVAKSLVTHGFQAAAIHGDLSQSQRNDVLESFKNGSLKILVASDVAARGLDIDSISHVFNFDVPLHPEDYVHRIGRTGRAGREGKAFTLISSDDQKKWTKVLGTTKATLISLEVPNQMKTSEKVDKEPIPQKTRANVIPPKVQKKPQAPERKRSSEIMEDRDVSVKGFGDHVPFFITVTFNGEL